MERGELEDQCPECQEHYGRQENAPSSCTVESIVRNMWNHFADGYNEWDSLGQDEKDTLFKIAVANYVIRKNAGSA